MKTTTSYRVTVYPESVKSKSFTFKKKEKYKDFLLCLKDDVPFVIVERATVENVIFKK